ncbi:hypothetical protein [Streptomyces sp. CAU 1734]|uniref:hypothetical protein n=1 Tax=Streptomyces sp. CAU 1734 TaxID=3140360 RepID=UPI0032612486
MTPAPLADEYLRKVQERVVAAPQGPWVWHMADDGTPDGFGPFSFVEAWDETQFVPAMEFCREARADVPALLGEIARLRTYVRHLENTARAGGQW